MPWYIYSIVPWYVYCTGPWNIYCIEPWYVYSTVPWYIYSTAYSVCLNVDFLRTFCGLSGTFTLLCVLKHGLSAELHRRVFSLV